MSEPYRLEVTEDADYPHATVLFGEETVGSIGGEPEDNTYYRTYSWVVPALNEAYQRGRDDEYARLQDKI